jgi:hypothetical protein
VPTFLSPLLRGADGYAIHNQRTRSALATHVLTAFDSRSRRTGLLKHDALPEGHGLVIAPCGGVHTFGMRFSIDIAFVDRNGRVLKTRERVPPWRMAASLRAFATIELPAGTLERTGTAKGDLLSVTATTDL